MENNNKMTSSLEQELIEELKELELLLSPTPKPQEEVGFELMMAELIDQIQDVCPNLRRVSSLRKSIAQYGDAYFFYDQKGDFCFLTDFLQDPREIESV
jgi:hypothetical protein